MLNRENKSLFRIQNLLSFIFLHFIVISIFCIFTHERKIMRTPKSSLIVRQIPRPSMNRINKRDSLKYFNFLCMCYLFFIWMYDMRMWKMWISIVEYESQGRFFDWFLTPFSIDLYRLIEQSIQFVWTTKFKFLCWFFLMSSFDNAFCKVEMQIQYYNWKSCKSQNRKADSVEIFSWNSDKLNFKEQRTILFDYLLFSCCFQNFLSICLTA